MVPSSQGQVWSLDVVDDILLCGHNDGTFVVTKDKRPQWISRVTGGWQIIPLPGLPQRLLQCTYTGFVVFEKTNERWRESHKVDGFGAPVKQMIMDETGQVWAVHPSRGLFRLSFSSGWDTITKMTAYGAAQGLVDDFQLRMSQAGDTLLIYTDSQTLYRAPGMDDLRPLKSLRGQPIRGVDIMLEGREQAWFRMASDRLCYHRVGASQWCFPIQLIQDYPRVYTLTNGYYLFGMDSGYALLPQQLKTTPPDLVGQILITEVRVEDEQSDSVLIFNPMRWKKPQSPVFQWRQNHISFSYAHPSFVKNTTYSYRLRGTTEVWSEWSDQYEKEFTFLRPGHYAFEVKSRESDTVATFEFDILPPWYQTRWAGLGYLLLTGLLTWLLYRWHLRRLSIQRRRMILEKERELTQERIRLRNEQLQADNIRKSQALANSTFNLIQKNNSLLKIREALDKLHKDSGHKLSDTHYHQLNRLIDKHLSNNEEWVVFEENFNDVHEHFFKGLKSAFPELTPGDLKLAAYLRMNLSSKEIAPLLGISVRGVENKRYRLRTKLGLDINDNLSEFLMML
ncbi:MAG: hypothetical protein R2795_12590 [Saprospiraceae bacterium]